MDLPTLTFADQEGGVRGPDPPENNKNIGFLSNTGPDPLDIRKAATKPVFDVVGTSFTPFQWRFTGGPMITSELS